MSYPCIESITRLVIDFLEVRVWREETEVTDAYFNGDLARVCAEKELSNAEWKIGELANRLASLPRVNAVEVKDMQGNGVVIYVNWP